MVQLFELWVILNGEPGLLGMFIEGEWCKYTAEMYLWADAVEAATCVPGDIIEVPVES